ncbi:MAG: ATP-dependent DNA helicase RecG [Chloroherpetonaceae bacterium]|nr:ATP-dependent DNA helicase RecG [Chloroherpetonaceae bacterium]
MQSASFFNTDIQFLKGVGPKRAGALNLLGIHTYHDLLHFYPRRYLDRTKMKSIGALIEGETATVVGEIRQIRLDGNQWKNPRLIVSLFDKSGRVDLVWFQGAKYIMKKFKEGDALAAWGKVGRFGSLFQITHPEIDILRGKREPDEEEDEAVSDYDQFNTGKIIPLYPSSEEFKKVGFTPRSFRKIVSNFLELALPLVEENFTKSLLEQYHLMPFSKALAAIHQPQSTSELAEAKLRLKWNELFFLQLFFALRNVSYHREKHSFACENIAHFTNELHKALPFELTNAQKRVIKEIRADMKTGMQMNRLIQGDVGSGKTIVAAFAMAIALDNHLQCAFMAPTEILATQHYLTLRRILEPLGVSISLLIGKQKKSTREEILYNLQSGATQIAVGTHALLEDGVKFSSLGLVIIDEQHRFGVLQRKALQDKSNSGKSPHILLMTATPIPRTLTMTVFGDLDTSIINELPKDRKPILTKLVSESQRARVYQTLRDEIAAGRQAYLVYPLVDESEKIDLAAAIKEYDSLKDTLFAGIPVGLIHGQLSPAEKDEVMQAFRSGMIKILFGTTVIEVGVDVSNATVMVIEHAERFGLSQLHQLRGRIGRGHAQSYCYLVYSQKLTNEARERLKAMEDTSDGFKISEIDAKLRGAGNIMGTEQSGALSLLRMTDLNADGELLQEARESAFKLIQRDPELLLPENARIKSYFQNAFKTSFSLINIG